MIRAETLQCPNCTAPLHLQNKQTLVACLYCNSTVHITYKDMAQPAAATRPDVSPEVVDEVKRLLVLGLRTKAIEYYARKAQVSEGDAAAAVATLHASLGYAPPLSNLGLLMLMGLLLLSLAGVLAGMILLLTGQTLLGGGVTLAAILFAGLNTLAFGRGLPGYLLLQRGQPAQAVIKKIWPIRTFAVRGQQAQLQRFLLEIHLPQQPVYQAEANGIVSAQSQPKFLPESRLSVKVDPTNRQNIVIIGPLEHGK